MARRSKPPAEYVRTAADKRAVAEGCWWDEKAAERVRDFFLEFLRHSKGEWAGQVFELLPWQWGDVVLPLFAWRRKDGTRRFRKAYIEVAKKNGKALDVHTPLPTPDGWKSMGSVEVGDGLFDEQGRRCRVVATTPVMVNRSCYRLRFSDGSTIVADARHEWVVRVLARRGATQTLRTEEMVDSVSARADGARNYSIPAVPPLLVPTRELPIPPYVLGIWLGDGNAADSRITCGYKDAEILESIRACGVSAEERTSSNAGSGLYILGRTGSRRSSIQGRLRALGVLNNKHIPTAYLRASQEQRLALLQGLMDSDGYISAAGQCEFTTTSIRLRVEARELICSLGFKSSTITGRAKINGRDCGPKYRIQFWAYRDRPVFRLLRKARRQKARPERNCRSETRQITAIEPVDSTPVRCVQVDSPSGMFLAGASMIPTHNSTLAAGLSLYLLVADLLEGDDGVLRPEPGAEVFSAAADREQASIIFREASNMVKASPELSSHVQVVPSTKRLAFPKTGSFYHALSADAYRQEGLNIHGLVFDELHAQKNRDLWDTLAYGGASRRQPLLIAITTAGWDRNSICYEQHRYAEQILDGTFDDWSFFAYIAAASEDDDWTDPKVWKKANPSFGETVKADEFAEACAEAQASPTKENTFKRYRLNIWTQQAVRWVQMAKWDLCNAPVNPAKLRGRECWGGLDLSSKLDITAFVLVFPPAGDDELYRVLPFFWIPEETARERERKDRVPYTTWARQGFVSTTPGNVVDYNFIKAKVRETAGMYQIRDVGYDPWNAQQMATDLEAEGLVMIEYRQGPKSFSEPMKELERLTISGKIAHGGHPVLRWMAGNVAVKEDENENIRPIKARKQAHARIDGIVGEIMALGRSMVAEPAKSSVYAERGLMVL